MELFQYMERYGYEQVVFCHDPGCGLKAIIAIHDTTLGPALGGVRVMDYPSEEAALRDVLRLARAMTYKSAAAGLALGGGKAVILGVPPAGRREACFRSFGRFLNTVGGRYFTTEDVGSYPQDMEWIAAETSYVTGLPLGMGGSGDTSPVTALGLHQALRAGAEEVWGSPSLKGRRIAVQGLGKVGSNLLPHLSEEGAILLVADRKEEAIARAVKQFGAQAVPPDAIYDAEVDIFSPNALGGVLNSRTIPRLRARVVCGAANNQLEEDEDGERLRARGILYAPDFIANAGGVINISVELTGYNRELAEEKVRGIYQTIKRVFARAKQDGVSPARAADKLAEERIEAVRRLKPMHQGDRAILGGGGPG